MISRRVLALVPFVPFVLSAPFVLFALEACGGQKAAPPPAAAAQGEAADGGDDGSASGDDAAAAPSASGDTSANANANASASASASSSAPPPPAPPPDECTPIAVDFEKRARPKLKDCYRDGKKKDPNLEGSVKITVDVNLSGKITATRIMQKTLPDPVAQCMLKVVKATPFPESAKCPGKSLTIPIQFPTPR